jgi:hypothetical protein
MKEIIIDWLAGNICFCASEGGCQGEYAGYAHCHIG